ncbi:hypothetical protein CIT31_26125 [Mesorhizobium wenxiniae]|uniref:Uncharacterized protein n=1 Tax=Mesorhizobium wenxiniae TaxID=2014805 RepID=A0A271KAK8_9HYPH|nr:hypothetical protein CIT31_26125 [Mesorhizobium wenxiniae]
MAHVFSRPTRAGIAGRTGQSFHAGAAPHLPAGILSPYSDGERSALIDGVADHQRYRMSTKGRHQPRPP